jgi:hypothetical protein
MTTSKSTSQPTNGSAQPAAAALNPVLASREPRATAARLLDLSPHQLAAIETVLLIQSRTFAGVDGPVEIFIADLVSEYAHAEDRKEGLTIEYIENRLAELRENMSYALQEAYFLADRYPRPQTSSSTSA